MCRRTNLAEFRTAFPRAVVEALEERLVLSTAPLLSAAATVTPAAAFTASPLPLGGNLNFQSDSIQDHPFVDLVKVTGGFYSLSGAAATTDANGWPTQDFTFSVDDQSGYDLQITPGTYSLSFTGPAGVVVAANSYSFNTGSISLTSTGYNATTGVYTYNVNVSSNVYKLAFTFTNTGGDVKNIHCLQPGYSLSNYPVYTTAYLNLLKALHPNVLRFMDFTQTNGNPDVNWSDRTLPTQPRAATNGVSWEDCIALANQLNVGMWVNVPAEATDDYVTQLATLIKNTLNPGLPVYVEYSNEVWNSAFSQYTYNLNAALAEVESNPNSNLDYDHLPITSANYDTFAERLYARRAMQISNIFASVWTSAGLANPINSEVRIVLAGQASYLPRFNTALSYINTVYGAPNQFFYSIAVAPYLELGPYADQYVSGVSGITAADLLQGIADSIAHYQSEDYFGQADAVAREYGLQLDAYEGGEDTSGSLNLAAKQQAILDPENTVLVERYLNLWYAAGGQQFNWYTLGARYQDDYGSWSITNDISNYSQAKELGYIAVGGETTASLAPTADAYVQDGPGAGQNFGSATQLLVQDATAGAGNVYVSYLKFNLAGVSSVNSALLELNGSAEPGDPEQSITIGAFPVSSSTWSQGTLTYSNAPTVGSTAISTASIVGTATQEYTLDVTSYIQQQLSAGNTNISIALEGTAITPVPAAFYSSQSASQGPQLFIGAASQTPAPTPTPTPTPSYFVTEGDTADSFVADGANASVNYGSATPLLVRNATPGSGNLRVAYLQFNLAGVAPITSAMLNLYGSEQSGAPEPFISVGIYPVASSNWTESGITYANAPAVGSTLLSAANIVGTTTELYLFDLTSYLQQQQAAGATSVTVAIEGLAPTTGIAGLSSREGQYGRPELVMDTTGPSTLPTPTPTPTPTPAPTATVTVPVSADAYVRDGSYANTNYGPANPLLVKDAISGDGYVRIAYLEFNLAGVAPIASAMLDLYGEEQAGATESSIGVTIYPVASTNWSQGTITFNNAPAIGSPALASGTIIGTTPQLYTFDLSSYLQIAQASGASSVTIAVEGSAYTNGQVGFNSSLASSNQPELVLQTDVPTPTPAPTVVSVTPEDDAGNGVAAGSAAKGQRSMETQMEVVFNEPVNLSSGAFALSLVNNYGSGSNDGSGDTSLAGVLGTPTNPSGDGETWFIPILSNGTNSYALKGTNGGISGGSLDNGVYQLNVVASDVTAATGGTAMAANYTSAAWHRLYGDVDNAQRVFNVEYSAFLGAFTSTTVSNGATNYNQDLDYDGDGRVFNIDYSAFLADFGSAKVYTEPQS